MLYCCCKQRKHFNIYVSVRQFYSSCYRQASDVLSLSLHALHCFRYDPDTDSWSTDVAPLSGPRSGVCLVAMDGYLYAVGGHDGITATNTVERWLGFLFVGNI